MISWNIPTLNKAQTEQLVRDMRSKTSDEVLSFWKDAIMESTT